MVGQYDWFAPGTMRDYFAQLFSRTESFDKNQIGQLLYKPTEMQFQEAAAQFHLIDDDTTSIFIQRDGGKALVEELKRSELSYPLLKKLSQYAVSVRKKDFQTLNDAGALEEINGIWVLSKESLYDDKVGLITDNQWLEETLII
jgi:CRISPR-associated endonuclease/helicase Cas3